MYITFYLFSEIFWSPLARSHLTSQENSEIHFKPSSENEFRVPALTNRTKLKLK